MCDSFIALADATLDGSLIFAKNSDRPAGEGQTVQGFPARQYEPGAIVACTYIEIPQASKTLSVLLSKIDWMWGAEMGVNEAGVVIGNEAVWTNLAPGQAALLGMDLVRLGLERGATALAAVEVITGLLQTFGQGGACANGDASFTYDNSFLIADVNEAYVLETAGKNWVAKRIDKGTANISNRLSIRAQYDLCSDGLREAVSSPDPAHQNSSIDFAARFSEASLTIEPGSREHWGAQYLAEHSGKISPQTMKDILQDHQSGICMHGGFETTASMVVQLHRDGAMNLWVVDDPHPCAGQYRQMRPFE